MQRSRYTVVSAALFSLLLASCSGSPKQDVSQNTESAAPTESTKMVTATAPIARGSSAAIQVVLSVQAVDHEKRLITLKGPEGNVGVYEVGQEVKRLSEIKAGDKLHAKYEVAAVAELREPTEEEKSAPLVEVTSDPQRMTEGPPAGAISRAVRAVTTIVSLDQSSQSVTVKDPVEGTVTAHVEDPTVFERLKVGQTIVVTFAETLALAVEPGAK